MTDWQKEAFEEKAKALMCWLCDYGHPHMTIIITPTSAELVEGLQAIETNEFVKG